ncbi:MAG: beta-propeller fold lactonase family protein [Bryobacteraceae bacterium]
MSFGLSRRFTRGFLILAISASAIASSQTPTFVYALNHQAEDITIFGTDPATGELSAVGSAPVGAGPETIVVTPNERFLYVSNIVSGSVSGFSVNAVNGQF